ncbi:hypothetical protein MTO96_043708 [Rhipicephalus appendiculatus]
MERGPKKRKRGHYKTYLNPKSQFQLPRTTSRACLQSDTNTSVPLSSDDSGSDTERADPPSRTASVKSWESDVDSPGSGRPESDEDFAESDNEPATSSVDSSADSALTAPRAAPEEQEQRNSADVLSQDFPASEPDAPSDDEAPLRDSIASFSDADDPSLFDEDEEEVILDHHVPQQGFPGDSLTLDDDMRGERAGGATKYPVQEVEPTERTELQMLNDMEIALKGGAAVHGVKTVSPLISLPHFNIVWSFVPDYMHCILLGVARQFLELWFNSDSPCSISRQQHIVDHRLMSVKPPRDVRRMPRPTKERRWWKAKELENWVLCYSVPVLRGILDKAYMQHWACLVEALHIMLQRTISPAELAIAEELLLEFHVRAEVLFGKSVMTFNMHQLTHIIKSVRHWGPLWAHSAFPFEAGNGNLKGAVKAANGIAHQVCRVLQMENIVVELEGLAVNRSVAEYCSSFDGTSTQKSILSSDGFRFFGRGSQHAPAGLQPSHHETNLEFTKYRRMLANGSIITDSMYASNKRTDSSVVELQDGCFVIIEGIYHGSDNKGYISARKLSCSPVKYNLVTMHHVLKVNRKAANATLIQCSQISKVVVFVDLESASYVCLPPSSFTL